jgi:hypothetical protein
MRETPHAFRGAGQTLMQTVGLRAQFGLACGNCTLQIADGDAEGGELLRHIIVQFPRHAGASLFLRIDQLLTERLQFLFHQTALGDVFRHPYGEQRFSF